MRRWLLSLSLAVLCPSVAQAHVVRVQIDRRFVIAGGIYERVEGRVYFAFDPRNPHDMQIVDLALAPRNAQGEVEAWSEFVMLRPVDPKRSNGVALIEVVNRGGGAGLIPFARGRVDSAGVAAEAYYGDSPLLRMGVTFVWLGWQYDIPTASGRLGLEAPVAGDSAHPITGLVRKQWVTVAANVGHSLGLGFYPVSDPGDPANVLTVRPDPLAEPTIVPRAEWSFARIDSVKGTLDDRRSIALSTGFVPGKIYELVYRAQDPRVAGVGLAAVRDFISYLKHDPANIAPVRFGIAHGSSQDGRFLRQLVYEGFNIDEAGRTAFDGLFVFIGGAGRGSFNQRFAEPGRTSWGYDSFFFPIDVFPFTSRVERDPVTDRSGSLFEKPGVAAHLPKILYFDGGHEYWGRAASLATTTVDGTQDVLLLPNERRYVVGSTQHGGSGGGVPAATARIAGSIAYSGDPLSSAPEGRALQVALIEWITKGTLPPPSRYPTIAAQQLAVPAHVHFPVIPGVAMARIPNITYRLDFGPHSADGILDLQPPRRGAPYVNLVPRVDSIGNDLGGIRSVDVTVPVATYFPWLLRRDLPGVTDRINSGGGMTVPLPKTERERAERGDSRPSLERLYRGKDDYLARVQRAAKELVARRFMLADDVAWVVGLMGRRWDWAMGQ